MNKNTIPFRCDCCGARFKAPDVEFRSSTFSTPQMCPECGSFHTLPAGIFSFFDVPLYRPIWNHIDSLVNE